MKFENNQSQFLLEHNCHPEFCFNDDDGKSCPFLNNVDPSSYCKYFSIVLKWKEINQYSFRSLRCDECLTKEKEQKQEKPRKLNNFILEI